MHKPCLLPFLLGTHPRKHTLFAHTRAILHLAEYELGFNHALYLRLLQDAPHHPQSQCALAVSNPIQTQRQQSYATT